MENATHERIIKTSIRWNVGKQSTDSTAKETDIEAVDTSSRLATLNEVMEVTTKPIIYDGDTGETRAFSYTVQNLERLGVSAVVTEDKKGLRKIFYLEQTLNKSKSQLKTFVKR